MRSFLISCIGWSFLLWLLSSTFEQSQAEVTRDEKDFLKFHGDRISSGIWERLIDFYNDTEVLKNICSQAHNKTQRIPGEITIFRCDQKKLIFSEPKYNPVDMEVIIYSIEGINKEDGIGSPYYFYVGKGLTSGCVFYLKPTDDEEKTFILDDHVCGLDIPDQLWK